MLAWSCDLIVASDDAFFADPVVRMGLPGVEFFAHPFVMNPRKAKEFLFLGDRMSAEEALRVGMINRVVTAEELLPVARKLADDMLSVVPECLSGYKGLINQGFAESFGDALKTERKVSSAANKSVSSESIAERRAGIQSRGKQQTGS